MIKNDGVWRIVRAGQYFLPTPPDPRNSSAPLSFSPLNRKFNFVFLAPFNLGPYSLIEEHKTSLENGIGPRNL